MIPKQNDFQQFLDSTDNPVQIVKVNVDQNRDLVSRFGIRGIPTLLLFKNSQQVAQRVGAASIGELKSFLLDNI